MAVEQPRAISGGEGRPTRLQCPVQHYGWGKRGDGLVAELAGLPPSTDEPCAELWMGTHPSGPSIVAETGRPLSELIGQGAGGGTASHGEGRLPFLFKVLSVQKALSIQAHPDRQLAKALHARDPRNYPDSNHKPEMAIAVSPFEALCGFRPPEQIMAFCQGLPELQKLFRPGDLKTMFTGVMRADREIAGAVAEHLLQHHRQRQRQTSPGQEQGSDHVPDCSALALFARLWGQYPDDVGCFCVFLLNHLQLQPGEALFLAANEPHAYISGDCIECMAESDNVVRAGLTPKYRDLDTLLMMLSYRSYGKDQLLVKPVFEADMTVYRPPVDEFGVRRIVLSPGAKTTLPPGRHAIVIVIEGGGSLGGVEYGRGNVFYLAPGHPCPIDASSRSLLFQAFQPF